VGQRAAARILPLADNAKCHSFKLLKYTLWSQQLLQLHAAGCQQQVVLMLSVPALHSSTSAYASAPATWGTYMHIVLLEWLQERFVDRYLLQGSFCC
jgi:hypothetical protein